MTPWGKSPGQTGSRAGARRRVYVHRFTLRHRRPIATALTFVAILLLGHAVTASREGRTVVVAARDLPAGARVHVRDLATVTMPTVLVPEGAMLEPGTAARRVLASPVRAGEVLTDARLVGDGLLAGLGAGMVASALRLADPATAALLRPGDTVDVLAATSDWLAGSGNASVGDDLAVDTEAARPRARIVAEAVTVLATEPSSSGSGLLGPGTSDEAGLVVVALSRAQAVELAAAAVGAELSFILSDPTGGREGAPGATG
ncbi:MAG: Flp pilus assembly protein CpaB [Candidatus Nanopelagicales bacterium]